jgi:hypothetical protein
MSGIGIEVLRIVLEDAVIHQKEIESLVNNREADKDILKLIHEQTQLLELTHLNSFFELLSSINSV